MSYLHPINLHQRAFQQPKLRPTYANKSVGDHVSVRQREEEVERGVAAIRFLGPCLVAGQ